MRPMVAVAQEKRSDVYARLGSVLVQMGKIDEAQLATAVAEQRRLGGGQGRNPKLGTVLIQLRMCTAGDVQLAHEHQELVRPRPEFPDDPTEDLIDKFREALAAVAEASSGLRTSTQVMRAATLGPKHG